MPNDSNRPDVAVFIDFENVYVSVRDKLDANPNFESIMDRCEDFGRVVIARAYADWYRYPRVTSALYANGIEPMYVPTYYYDREMGRTGRAIKNSVDMNLCIDAMKTLYTNTNIAKFVLATGDRDFIPLVNSIRQQGKEVIIIGIGGAASAHLAQSADEFIFYESLVGKKPAELQKDQPRAKSIDREREQPEVEEEPVRPREREVPREKEPAAPDIYDVLVNAINLARERGYVCSFGSLKLLMKELMGGDFKEGRYKDSSGKPFAKFKDFVLEAERRGKVQVFTNGTVNEVFLPGEDPYKLSQFAQDLKEEPAAPLLEAPQVPVRHEPRPTSSANGRRRRRRTRGGQRTTPALEEDTTLLEEPVEEPVEEEEVEEIEYMPPDELLIPELEEDDQADAVFEELLGRVEDEDAQFQALAALDPLEIMDLTIAPPEQTIAEPEEPVMAEAGEALSSASSQPFTEEEWRLLTTVVARHERPISFAQIHDALRDARKSAGITRTNEELRSLIKQAINSGLLARSGKGNRVTYRLAPQAEEAGAPALEALEVAGQAEPAATAPAEAAPTAEEEEGAPDQAALIASAESEPPATGAETAPVLEATPAAEEDDAPDQARLIAPAEGEQPKFYTPEAAAEAELATPAEAAPIEVITAEDSTIAEAAPARPKRSRPRRKPAAEATPVEAAPTQAAPAEEKRGRSRKAPPTAAAPEEAAPAKPRRTRRKKTETAE